MGGSKGSFAVSPDNNGVFSFQQLLRFVAALNHRMNVIECGKYQQYLNFRKYPVFIFRIDAFHVQPGLLKHLELLQPGFSSFHIKIHNLKAYILQVCDRVCEKQFLRRILKHLPIAFKFHKGHRDVAFLVHQHEDMLGVSRPIQIFICVGIPAFKQVPFPKAPV